MATPEDPFKSSPARSEYELTSEDRIRMRTVQAGDEVSDYIGFPDIQRDIIMRERASREVSIPLVAFDDPIDSCKIPLNSI